MRKVVVLGGSGMLGSAVVAGLAADSALEVHASARRAHLSHLRERLGRVRWFEFDAETDSLDVLPGDASWLVNAIGVIKHHIDVAAPATVASAIALNALLPQRLATWGGTARARIVQIATDCVFSGRRGAYIETDAHDASDVYGKTKSLGEVRSPGFVSLRCSIVGPELLGLRAGAGRSLLEWFRARPPGARVEGFTDHRWNGVTTLHFARLVHAVVRGGDDLELPSIQHIVPADVVSKAELLQQFAWSFGREDVTIVPVAKGPPVDRSLATAAPLRNEALWRAAGYARPPSIREMVEEVARWAHPLLDGSGIEEART